MEDLLRRERLTLVRHLRGLDDEDWARPSLCAGWAVRDVVAHLVTPFVVSLPRMAVSMLRHGPAGAMDVWARSIGQRPPAELVDLLEANAGSTFHPPGLPLAAPLTDVLVHGVDVRWALQGHPSVDHVDPASVVPSLQLLTERKAVGVFLPAGRLDGVRLVADDADFARGSGPTISGPALALAAGACGRESAYALLSGEGLAGWRA